MTYSLHPAPKRPAYFGKEMAMGHGEALRFISDPDPETVRKECERAWLEVERMGLDKRADVISHKGNA